MLAGCGAAQDVELESRNIQLNETAEPAAYQAGSDNLQSAVRESGPTYVTLTVSEINPDAGKDYAKEKAVTSGSGFLVDRSGYVFTAAHVAVRKDNVVAARAANGRIYAGKVIAVFPNNDMALIKLKGYLGKTVSPSPQACMAKGTVVYSLGKPHAQGDTARVGSLEAMHFGRAVQYGPFGYPDAMVLHMNTQKGESGGPVFNAKGQLVGMVVSTLSDGNGRPLNWATPFQRLGSRPIFAATSAAAPIGRVWPRRRPTTARTADQGISTVVPVVFRASRSRWACTASARS
jgi:S1-C subfamily serine protease